MKTEVEARILDINVSELIVRLEKVGAKFINNYNQRRYIYDFNPVQKRKWIRLRTDGEKTRSYQENKRTRYIYNDIEIDIDTWPKIPTYVEFEGSEEDALVSFIESLGYAKEDLITYGVSKIYKHYGLDIDDYDILKFD